MSNLRRCAFTWNNYQEDFESRESLVTYFNSLPNLKWYVIGFEVGENGTHHLQGAIGFDQPKTFNTLREYLKNNHIEKVKQLDKLIDYCKKEQDYIQYGDVVYERQRTDIMDFVDAVKNGASNVQLMEEFPNLYLKNHNMINQIKQDLRNEQYSKTIRQLKVIYIYGDAGIGKTRYVYDRYGFQDVYRVTDYKNPFDMYNGQKVLVLDEYRTGFTLSRILNILDIYPYMLPSRYSDKVACYDTVFIISNIPLSEQYPYLQQDEPKSFEALLRRIHLSIELTHDRSYENQIKVMNNFLEGYEI